MATRKTHDAIATVGTYKTNQGEEKKRYLKVGSLFQDEQGRLSLKLDAVPVAKEWSGWISFYEADRGNQDNRQGQSQQHQRQQPRPQPTQSVNWDVVDDDSPF